MEGIQKKCEEIVICAKFSKCSLYRITVVLKV